jgi:hypothetical protein
MPADAIALLIVLLFAVPGFITRTLIARSIPRQQGDAQQWVVEVVLFGAVSFLITTVAYSIVAGTRNEPLPDLAHFPPHDPPLIVAAVVYAAGFMVLPAVIGYVLVTAYELMPARLMGVRHVDAAPRAWDYFFSQGRPCLVVATLMDGTKVAGYMGTNSFAASFPSGEDLYLERQFYVEDGIVTGQPILNGEGIWIQGSQIKFLEFYEPRPRR